jgi:phosphoribosylaminoimidazolecarboxamide formyltransferase / IMP cyclohydrolase
VSGRIAVGVSGAGTNLNALRRYEQRGLLGAEIALVLADRPCDALGFAADEGIPSVLIDPTVYDDRESWDVAVRDALSGADIDWVVLAGFMRVLGRETLAYYKDRILNIHPSLLPSFPGAHAVSDALAAGVRVTGATVHIVDATLDGGPIVAQRPVQIVDDDTRQTLLERVHAVEYQLYPRIVSLALAGAVRLESGRASIDWAAAADLPQPRRALISVSDKTALVSFAERLAGIGFEIVSTGGTAKALRNAGVVVTDVADVTGFPEMLDGRVKTLHPRISAGVLADQRLEEHRAQLAAQLIDPFELVVVNLYPFAEAAARTDTGEDELIEQIDIGGPTLVRAAAKNHASVGIVTDPAQYDAVMLELGHGKGLTTGMRRELAAAAFRVTAGYDALISEELSRRWLARRATFSEEHWRLPTEGRELPPTFSLQLERVQSLRYGENPHQAAALYRVSGADVAPGTFSAGALVVQGKPLSYNNILDAAAASGLARDLRGAACVIVKHANPCGAAEAADAITAWEQALAGDPVSAYGGVTAVMTPIDAALADRLVSIFLEVVVAPAVAPDALEILARRPNLRVVLDPTLGAPPVAGLEFRSAGGAILATEADVAADDPAAWTVASKRAPTADELDALDFAWRICRHVKSNAIVLAQGHALVGVGAGQMSRVDSARLAVAKAGPERARGAVCASDAFYPFADAAEVCLVAGATAFAQPGGSQRDAEVVAAVDKVDATMLLTGIRHFRH